MIKGSIYREDITILSLQSPNDSAAKYIKQKLAELKGETKKPTVRVGSFNSPFSFQ